MKKNLLPHIITATAFAVFIVLGLACMTVGPKGAELATPRNRVSDSNAEAAFNRGNEAYEAGNYDQAIEEYTEAIWRVPSSSRENAAIIYNNRGLAYMGKGDFSRAISDFEEALRINPNNDNAKSNLETARWEQQNSWTLIP